MDDEHKKVTFIGVFVAVLVLVGSLAGLWYINQNTDDTKPAVDVPLDTVVSDSNSDINVEAIEQRARIGEPIWQDDALGTSELLSEDDDNNNVEYSFIENSFTVASNGLPNHETGQFPNPNNPNSISEQDFEYLINRGPVYVGSPTDVRISGITIGGLPMEPGTAETDSETGWSIEAFNPSQIFKAGTDDNNAHVQPNGTYHYHAMPFSLLTTGEDHSNLIGIAADGFPIYYNHGYSDPLDPASPIVHLSSSWKIKEGQRASGEPEGEYTGDFTQDYEFVAGSGDLDQCNGRFAVTPEFPDGTYVYYITDEFPYISRCVMGELLDSFNVMQPGGSGGMQPGGPGQMPPPR